MSSYDNGTGFARLIDPVEARFGATPVFGYAGGCVNMVLDLESGHRINVTDAEQCFLTHIDERTAETGFSVGVYTRVQFDNGQAPTVMLTRYVGADGLVELIADAIAALRMARSI